MLLLDNQFSINTLYNVMCKQTTAYGQFLASQFYQFHTQVRVCPKPALVVIREFDHEYYAVWHLYFPLMYGYIDSELIKVGG